MRILLSLLLLFQTASGGIKLSGGVALNNQILPKNAVFDGDSITFGTGVTTPWPSLINTTGYTTSNIAVAGSNCGSAGFTSRVSAVMVSGTPNVIYIWCGTNNIAGGQTPSTAYGFLASYISGARSYAAANGIPNLTMIVATMLSRDNPAGLDTNRATWNNLIRANSAGADSIVDFDPTNLGCNGCASNTTYFNTDKIHPNNTGETTYIVPAMQAVLP